MNDSMKQLSQEREVIEKEVSELQKQIKTMEEAGMAERLTSY